jgi:hypothetical protein
MPRAKADVGPNCDGSGGAPSRPKRLALGQARLPMEAFGPVPEPKAEAFYYHR